MRHVDNSGQALVFSIFGSLAAVFFLFFVMTVDCAMIAKAESYGLESDAKATITAGEISLKESSTPGAVVAQDIATVLHSTYVNSNAKAMLGEKATVTYYELTTDELESLGLSTAKANGMRLVVIDVSCPVSWSPIVDVFGLSRGITSGNTLTWVMIPYSNAAYVWRPTTPGNGTYSVDPTTGGVTQTSVLTAFSDLPSGMRTTVSAEIASL